MRSVEYKGFAAVLAGVCGGRGRGGGGAQVGTAQVGRYKRVWRQRDILEKMKGRDAESWLKFTGCPRPCLGPCDIERRGRSEGEVPYICHYYCLCRCVAFYGNMEIEHRWFLSQGERMVSPLCLMFFFLAGSLSGGRRTWRGAHV